MYGTWRIVRLVDGPRDAVGDRDLERLGHRPHDRVALRLQVRLVDRPLDGVVLDGVEVLGHRALNGVLLGDAGRFLDGLVGRVGFGLVAGLVDGPIADLFLLLDHLLVLHDAGDDGRAALLRRDARPRVPADPQVAGLQRRVDPREADNGQEPDPERLPHGGSPAVPVLDANQCGCAPVPGCSLKLCHHGRGRQQGACPVRPDEHNPETGAIRARAGRRETGGGGRNRPAATGVHRATGRRATFRFRAGVRWRV